MRAASKSLTPSRFVGGCVRRWAERKSHRSARGEGSAGALPTATASRAGWRLAMLVLVLTLLPGSAPAAELLMFEKPGCPWCARWDAEVAPGYSRSPEGRRAPLRRLDVRARPAGVMLAAPITHSPTFVLVDRGREVGRITGYPGADFFWGLLEELLAKLDRGARVEPLAARPTLSAGPRSNAIGMRPSGLFVPSPMPKWT